MNHQDLINRCERTADVQNAIATADHAARLAGLPTYTELAAILNSMVECSPQAFIACRKAAAGLVEARSRLRNAGVLS